MKPGVIWTDVADVLNLHVPSNHQIDVALGVYIEQCGQVTEVFRAKNY